MPENSQTSGNSSFEHTQHELEKTKNIIAHRGEAFVDQGYKVLSGSLHTLAESIRKSASSIREEHSQFIGAMVEEIGTMVDQIGSRLEERKSSDMIHSFKQTVRNHPAVTLSALGVAGILMGRGLRSLLEESGGTSEFRSSGRGSELGPKDYSRTTATDPLRSSHVDPSAEPLH